MQELLSSHMVDRLTELSDFNAVNLDLPRRHRRQMAAVIKYVFYLAYNCCKCCILT